MSILSDLIAKIDLLADRVGDEFKAQAPIDNWPVGSVFMSVVSTNPNTLLGGGTWVAWGTGRMPIAIDTGDADFNVVEETGGAKTVALTAAQNGTHNHGVTVADSTSHSHGITVDTSTSHSHGITVDNGGAHYHTAVTGGHSANHKHSVAMVTGAGGSNFGINRGNAAGALTTSPVDWANADHTHSMSSSWAVPYDHGHTGSSSGGSHAHTGSSSGGSHGHTASSADSGSGTAHQNMPPYITCYMWKRTA